MEKIVLRNNHARIDPWQVSTCEPGTSSCSSSTSVSDGNTSSPRSFTLFGSSKNLWKYSKCTKYSNRVTKLHRMSSNRFLTKNTCFEEDLIVRKTPGNSSKKMYTPPPFRKIAHEEVRSDLDDRVKIMKDFKSKLSREVKDFASLSYAFMSRFRGKSGNTCIPVERLA